MALSERDCSSAVRLSIVARSRSVSESDSTVPGRIRRARIAFACTGLPAWSSAAAWSSGEAAVAVCDTPCAEPSDLGERGGGNREARGHGRDCQQPCRGTRDVHEHRDLSVRRRRTHSVRPAVWNSVRFRARAASRRGRRTPPQQSGAPPALRPLPGRSNPVDRTCWSEGSGRYRGPGANRQRNCRCRRTLSVASRAARWGCPGGAASRGGLQPPGAEHLLELQVKCGRGRLAGVHGPSGRARWGGAAGRP